MIPDRDAIIAEIVEMTNPDPQRPDEFTIREFMEAGGANGQDVARRRLDRLVEHGTLEKRKTIANGRESWVYRKTTGVE